MQITLLRGNHEVRALQQQYSYRAECMNKYGTEYGPKIFEITNRMFDSLPICAVVDDAIFCAHGGIPKAALTLEEIGTVPVEMDNPFQQSTIAWEILWSDPMP